MQFSCEVIINMPREKVIETFDNTDNLMKWMKGLQSFNHISGEPGHPGAKSRLVFDQNGRRLEMIETIDSRNLPDEFAGTYITHGLVNKVTHRFYEDGAEKTKWISENEFQFSGLMKLMIFFTRHAFPKQTQIYMENFKKFAKNA